MTNAEFRRVMTGDMPTGECNMSEMKFSIRRTEPAKEIDDYEYESLGHWGLFPLEDRAE